MVERIYKVVWTKRSQQHLKNVYNFISEDSPQNAKKVIEEILFAIDKTALNPEIYNQDKYKKNNDRSYRAFEKCNYRISYRPTKNFIMILRIRHTKMNPKKY